MRSFFQGRIAAIGSTMTKKLYFARVAMVRKDTAQKRCFLWRDSDQTTKK